MRSTTAPSFSNHAGVGGAGGRPISARSIAMSSELRTGFGLAATTTPSGSDTAPSTRSAARAIASQSSM